MNSEDYFYKYQIFWEFIKQNAKVGRREREEEREERERGALNLVNLERILRGG